MTEKRFTVHIVWLNYDKTDGEITLKDNGQPLLECDCVEDVQMVKDLLNELHEEKEMWKRECERLKGLYYLNEKDEHLAWKRVDVE